MKLKESLMLELKKAMQNKEIIKKETITMLRAAILQTEKDGQKELTEPEVFSIVVKEIKKRKESISDFKKGNRLDIVERIEKEIEVLQKYMPKQLSDDEILEMVLVAIKKTESTSIKNIGKVMQEIKDKTLGAADGRLVSEIVKKELSKL